ncbi:hypothetical protein ACFX13_007539 [Malus domestica]
MVALSLLPILVKNTYISENALMPGSVASMLSNQEVVEASRLVSDLTSSNLTSLGSAISSRIWYPINRFRITQFKPGFWTRRKSMEQQRQITIKRIAYLLDRGIFKGWLTDKGVDAELRKFAFFEVIRIFDHSLAVKLGVHFFLWGSAILLFGTKRHHDKWLNDTENYAIKGCFAMSELGHDTVGSITKLTSFTILAFLLQGASSLQGGSHVKSLSEGPEDMST